MKNQEPGELAYWGIEPGPEDEEMPLPPPPTDSELFEEQTRCVERAVRALNDAVRILNITMPIKTAPANWDHERWVEATTRLDYAIQDWHKMFDKWVAESQ